MQLVDGRPGNTEGRPDKEIRVYDFLDSLGIAYKRVDHEAAMTMEACEEIANERVRKILKISGVSRVIEVVPEKTWKI